MFILGLNFILFKFMEIEDMYKFKDWWSKGRCFKFVVEMVCVLWCDKILVFENILDINNSVEM